MKKLVLIIVLISTLLLMHPFIVCASDNLTSSSGLNLGEVISKKVRKKIYKLNPHLEEFECSECHKRKKIEIKGKKRRRKRPKKRNAPIPDVIKLCDSCHAGENLHPVDVNPRKSSLEITPPLFLPLGKGKYKDKIICTTCHDIHAKRSAEKLLRGFPGAKGSKTARLKERQDFCRACHGEKLIERSPHKGDKQSCKFCHVTDPEKVTNKLETVRLDIVKRCNFCHDKLEEAHFLAVNAFADKALQDELPDVDLPFIGGEITCVTCHDQHWKSTLPHKLRPNFVAFAEKSVRINPHWTGTFCLSCHDKPPKKGNISFLFDGDFVKVCNRCHETEEATADIHPVNIEVPPEMLDRMPKDFMLAEGNLITCVTCHELKYQTSINNPLRRKDPKFLRGGPYADRADICYKCHEGYGGMNPHAQIDENGEIIESKCLFCHASRPDVNVIGIDKVRFSGNVTEYCYGCHQGKEEQHPVNVTHTGRNPTKERRDCIKKAEMKLRIIFPLYNDEVFCGTCHNPHQRGVLKGAANKGADKQSRLRMKEGYAICIVCHCDKGDL